MPSPTQKTRHPRRAVRLMSATCLALCALAATRSAGAQSTPRPPLEAGADTNDWRAYYRRGIAIVRARPGAAQDYFREAAALDPQRGEPLFALWAAFWLGETGLLHRYFLGQREVLERPEVLAADSLRVRALSRNPFVDQSLQLFIGYEWHEQPVAGFDDESRAWAKYANGDYRGAALLFADASAGAPDRPGLRYDLALALQAAARPDSATVVLRSLIGTIRAGNQRVIRRRYESIDVFEYTLGYLRAMVGDTADARAAFTRALEDNLAFAPAHQGLGRLALQANDPAAAVTELAQAIELAPDEPVYRQQLGAALYVARRPAEAAAAFSRAVTLAPQFAEAWFGLAASEDVQGHDAAAREAYAHCLAVAARSAPYRPRAEERLRELSPR